MGHITLEQQFKKHGFAAGLTEPQVEILASLAYHLKNSSRAMLYTRFVIGEDTESRTRVFSRCNSFVCGTTIKAVI
jgi:hypothetical protein